MKKIISHKRKTPNKKRSSSCYQRKIDKVTDWYNRLLEERKIKPAINPNNNLPYKRKELKGLDFYIGKIKKSL